MVSLLVAIASFLVWILLVFVRPIGLGVVHILWGLTAVLIIRWWALRDRSEV